VIRAGASIAPAANVAGRLLAIGDARLAGSARAIILAAMIGASLALAGARGAAAQTAPTGPAPLTSATIAPSLSPDRLGAKGAVSFTITYAGGAFGVPSPVRRSIVRFPAGMTLDIPSLRSCSKGRLLARGPSGCPARSKLGHGTALVEVRAGTEIVSEEVTLSAFLGPLRNLVPTVEVLGQGYTPLDERMVLTGTVLPASAPYGEELVMPIPPLPTLMFEPDASVVRFSLTVGTSGQRRTRNSSSVSVPRRCPVGGFPFSGEFTYADGSSGGATARLPCPRRAL
jgi:hypothetical protein